jgi:hypothetical protein
MHEVGLGAHPDLRRDLDVEVRQPLGRDQPAVGGASGEGGVLRPEQQFADGRVDPVGADQEVDLDRRAVLERRSDPVAVLGQAEEPMAGVQALGRERAGERAEQVGAVHLVVREAEGPDDGVAQVGAQQRAPVVPAALVPGERAHAHPRQVLGEAQAMQDPRGVGADLDPGADLADGRRALVDVHVEAGLQQRQRRRDPADAATDDRDRGVGRSCDVQVLAVVASTGKVA